MKQQDLSYAVCTVKNGITVLKDIEGRLDCRVYFPHREEVRKCGVKGFNLTFSPGEYLALQIDLTKLNIPFEDYYICFYSNFPIYETGYPRSIRKPRVARETFECSDKFSKSEYHHVALSGFALDEKGEYILARLYAFPGSLPKSYDFENNLEKAVKVFEVKGEIA